MISNITLFPTPIIETIFNFLQPQESARSREVCKLFYNIIESVNSKKIISNHAWLNSPKIIATTQNLPVNLKFFFRFCLIYPPFERSALLNNWVQNVLSIDSWCPEKINNVLVSRLKNINDGKVSCSEGKKRLTDGKDNFLLELDAIYGGAGASWNQYIVLLTQTIKNISTNLAFEINKMSEVSIINNQEVEQTYNEMIDDDFEIKNFQLNNLALTVNSLGFYDQIQRILHKYEYQQIQNGLIGAYHRVYRSIKQIHDLEQRIDHLDKIEEHSFQELKALQGGRQEYIDFTLQTLRNDLKVIIKKVKKFELHLKIIKGVDLISNLFQYISSVNKNKILETFSTLPLFFQVSFWKDVFSDSLPIQMNDEQLIAYAELHAFDDLSAFTDELEYWKDLHQNQYNHDSYENELIEMIKNSSILKNSP